ncbi:MAG: ABC transporter permease [Ancalomicrobiaceae bacterium]|nr:ABC transporter permease [Ancalomicrobiaceae bacterium]
MVLRHWYLLRSSWPRVVEIIYWPAVNLLTWGLVQTYVQQHSGFFANAAGLIIGAMLLSDILIRGQQGFSFAFLEELWSRNIGNLMMSPLRPSELIASLMVVSLVRLAIGMIPVSLVAIALFGFNIWGLGWVLALFFLNLILTGWSVGIVIAGLLLRQGMGAESFAWTVIFAIVPITCVYYPVATLPSFVQPVAWMLPPTYVFEGMRAALIDHSFRADLMLEAFLINLALMAAATVAFYALLASARRQGSLLSTGE